MKINLAHLRERSTTGGWIDFAVFDAKSNSGSDADNQTLLSQLTVAARQSGLKVDQSALAYRAAGQVRFFGDKHLVQHLSKQGVPTWTHSIDV